MKDTGQDRDTHKLKIIWLWIIAPDAYKGFSPVYSSEGVENIIFGILNVHLLFIVFATNMYSIVLTKGGNLEILRMCTVWGKLDLF